MPIIFVMIDGLGLAAPGAHNAVAAGMPRLARLFGRPLDTALLIESEKLVARPIDATLGVPGLPQSGSGHTAIYGGYNAAAANGRHQPSYPTVAMREQLARRNLFAAARERGYRVAWANAYLSGSGEAVERRRIRYTAGTWAALQAGLHLRGLAELLDGTAISWDLTQDLARQRPGCDDLPVTGAGISGRRLVKLARGHDLVGFETYLPDLAAHGRLPWSAPEALDRVDCFLAAVIEAKTPADTLVFTSDHGNVEDMSTRVHTRNPAPLVALGPAAGAFSEVRAIDGVMDAILQGLERA